MTSSAAAPPSGYAVDVVISRPARSSRLLLLFRGFLLLPQLLLALPVIVIATVLLYVNYLVVLITGHAAFSGFLSGTVRYLTRLNAYAYFLTDKYPPFSLGECADYPARVLIEPPGHIHRWRVFSGLLALPHFIVLYALVAVSSVATLISFIVVLITGRYPAGLFGITAATIRYQARVNAYLYLITSHYPPFSLS
jgi:hypothetical protein